MAVELTLFKQKVPHKFQTLTHQISLLAGFHTLSNLFHYKTLKQPILRHLSIFPMYLKVDLAEVIFSM